jgi:hypothetical protein
LETQLIWALTAAAREKVAVDASADDLKHMHKRDRYGRPEDAVDMVSREKKLLLAGITIVFSDSIAEPMERGRHYLERELGMLFG